MSRFKKGDMVRVIADNSPTQEGTHLIGLTGKVLTVTDGDTYKYRIYHTNGGRILAQADELELVPMFKVGDNVLVASDDHANVHDTVVGLQGEVVYVDLSRHYAYSVKLEDGRRYRGAAHELRIVGKDGFSIGGGSAVVDLDAQKLLDNMEALNATLTAKAEAVKHPAHYGGDTTYEVIKVAEAWGLDKDAYLFNVLKYIARADKKGNRLEDLKKGEFYLNRRINELEEAK